MREQFSQELRLNRLSKHLVWLQNSDLNPECNSSWTHMRQLCMGVQEHAYIHRRYSPRLWDMLCFSFILVNSMKTFIFKYLNYYRKYKFAVFILSYKATLIDILDKTWPKRPGSSGLAADHTTWQGICLRRVKTFFVYNMYNDWLYVYAYTMIIFQL